MNKKATCAVLFSVAAVGGISLWPFSHQQSTVSSPSLSKAALVALTAASALSPHSDGGTGAANLVADVPAEIVDLQTALEQGTLKADFKGNGRETLTVTAFNKSTKSLRVRIDVGLVLESGRSAVVVVRPTEVVIEPGKSAESAVQTAATRSTNVIADGTYVLTYNHVPRIELLLTYLQEHPEVSPAAVQTAVLAMTENLPLSSVARFPSASSEVTSRFNTDAFRVETFDILSALAALRGLGVSDAAVAMTVDPQLRIEAMIEPLCRSVAMRYYGLTPETEWAFWKNELLSGEPTTRHYALYGIARFYPEIAMEMLPKWARETKTHPVMRMTAVQALADTQRSDAVPVLNQLAEELGRATELGRAARGAALALDQRLGALASAKTAAVSFRASQELNSF